MIDLHLHTTASDGLLAPDALVARAQSVGLTIISVTDHDTVSGLADAARAGARVGVRVVPGIEITAVDRGRDVHVLGYFIDPVSERLTDFLQNQRADRVRRVREMGAKLESLGYPVDVDAILGSTRRLGRTVGRPAIADALVASGQVASRDDAFQRLLARGRPAFVPRAGPDGADVIRMIHSAGGIASLAHPRLLNDDSLIPVLAEAGLDALEVWHSDHSPQDEQHYSDVAARCLLLRSGGSDYHGEGVHRASRLGGTLLPPEAFAALDAHAAKR